MDDEITLTVDLEVPEKNWNLELMNSIFYDNLSVENDFEYAIGVLLDYGTDGSIDGDVEQALDEISDSLDR